MPGYSFNSLGMTLAQLQIQAQGQSHEREIAGFRDRGAERNREDRREEREREDRRLQREQEREDRRLQREQEREDRRLQQEREERRAEQEREDRRLRQEYERELQSKILAAAEQKTRAAEGEISRVWERSDLREKAQNRNLHLALTQEKPRRHAKTNETPRHQAISFNDP